MMKLEVLPRRDVALAQRGVVFGDVGERLHLRGSYASERQFDAHHLHTRLPLAVYALLEAELDERVFRRLAIQELCRFGREVIEFALEDWKHSGWVVGIDEGFDFGHGVLLGHLAPKRAPNRNSTNFINNSCCRQRPQLIKSSDSLIFSVSGIPQ